MTLSKYDIETLMAKANHLLNDYKSFKDALGFIPESSILGSLGVKASIAMTAKKYEKVKSEILCRKPNKDIINTLTNLELVYNYRGD